MRMLVITLSLAALGGCSSMRSVPEAWSWNATDPQARTAVPAEEIAGLNARAAQLQQERNEIRTRISAEPDIWARQRLYKELHGVGVRLSRVERRLSGAIAAR